jgi:hypothetical protein
VSVRQQNTHTTSKKTGQINADYETPAHRCQEQPPRCPQHRHLPLLLFVQGCNLGSSLTFFFVFLSSKITFFGKRWRTHKNPKIRALGGMFGVRERESITACDCVIAVWFLFCLLLASSAWAVMEEQAPLVQQGDTPRARSVMKQQQK